MLLGTYQPLFRSGCDPAFRDHAYKAATGLGAEIPVPMEEFGACWADPGGTSEDDMRYIGFDPLWCFPCRTPEEAFVQSALASPNAADLFFLVEAGDYVRIDRVKWEGHIRNGTSYPEQLAECIAPEDLDDAMCDFLIPVAELKEFKLACVTAGAYGMAYTLQEGLPFSRPGRECYIDFRSVEEAVPGFRAGLAKADIEISRIRKGHLSEPDCAEHDEKETDRLLVSKLVKNWFECSVLSPLVSIASSGFQGSDAAEFFRTAVCLDNLARTLQELAAWAEGPRDYAGYEAVMGTARTAWCGSKEILSIWMDGRPWPGRNDRCPCGSGRKFKKCCGRKYGLC